MIGAAEANQADNRALSDLLAPLWYVPFLKCLSWIACILYASFILYHFAIQMVWPRNCRRVVSGPFRFISSWYERYRMAVREQCA